MTQAVEHSAVQEAALLLLEGMGFQSRQFNAELLQLHDNNVQKVIEDLVAKTNQPTRILTPPPSLPTVVS